MIEILVQLRTWAEQQSMASVIITVKIRVMFKSKICSRVRVELLAKP